MRQPAAPVKSSGIGDDEPWELEDSGEEKPAVLPQDTSFFAAFKDDEQFNNTLKSDAPQNFFDDAFNPPTVEVKQSPIATRMAVKENKQDDDDDDDDVNYPSAATADPAFFASNLSDRRRSSIDVVITQPDDDVNQSKSSTTSDSDELEINEIQPTFAEQAERPIESLTMAATPRSISQSKKLSIEEDDDLPPPLPALTRTCNPSEQRRETFLFFPLFY